MAADIDETTDSGTAEAASVAALVQQAKLATLGMLVAGVAHELNTPLGALHSNHDLLRRSLSRLHVILEDEVVTADELDEVRRIVGAVRGIVDVNDLAMNRMVQLVRDLRNFGRIDRADIDWVDLREGIESTIAILGAEARRVRLVAELGALPLVRCQPNRLNQVWMNLLLNAIQATPEGGRVTIRTRSTDAVVFVEVSDTGSGIAPEHVDHIFEPGFTTKSGRVSMGLGLAIVREIVQQHGGKIAVSSEPGMGTQFAVELPVAGPPESITGNKMGGKR